MLHSQSPVGLRSLDSSRAAPTISQSLLLQCVHFQEYFLLNGVSKLYSLWISLVSHVRPGKMINELIIR